VAVPPSDTSSLAITPDSAARPAWNDLMVVPKFSRKPAAELPAIPMTRATADASSPRTFAAATAAPKVPTVPFTCGTTPPWYPLGREHLALFDEQEHVTVRGDSPASPTTHGNTLPAATQKVLVGSASLPSPYASGWMFLDLNATVTPAGPNPTQDPAAAQAYVLTVRNLVAGSFGNIGMEGGPADRLDSAANSAHTGPPLPPPGQH